MWKCPALIIWLWISFKFQFPLGPMACLRLPLWLPTWDALLLQWNIRASLRPGSHILVWSYIYKYKGQGSWRLVQNLPSSLKKKSKYDTKFDTIVFSFIFKFGFDWSRGSYKHSQDSVPIVSFLHFIRKLFVEFHLHIQSLRPWNIIQHLPCKIYPSLFNMLSLYGISIPFSR